MKTTHYETGIPCRNGHIAPRLSSTGACTKCASDAQKRFKRDPLNRERIRVYENERRRRKGYNSEAQKRRQRKYDRKKRGLPEPTRECPDSCECCGQKFVDAFRTHLDHCHSTGVFRGWLCNKCNLGIGQLGDSLEGVQRAIDYLRRITTSA